MRIEWRGRERGDFDGVIEGVGVEERGEFVERKRGKVGAIKGVGVEVEDGFTGGGGSSGKDGFR